MKVSIVSGGFDPIHVGHIELFERAKALSDELWVILKGVLVLLLTHYHFYLGKCVRLFATNQNTKTSKFFRIINEVPTILLILIVFIVVFKPI